MVSVTNSSRVKRGGKRGSGKCLITSRDCFFVVAERGTPLSEKEYWFANVTAMSPIATGGVVGSGTHAASTVAARQPNIDPTTTCSRRGRKKRPWRYARTMFTNRPHNNAFLNDLGHSMAPVHRHTSGRSLVFSLLCLQIIFLQVTSGKHLSVSNDSGHI